MSRCSGAVPRRSGAVPRFRPSDTRPASAGSGPPHSMTYARYSSSSHRQLFSKRRGLGCCVLAGCCYPPGPGSGCASIRGYATQKRQFGHQCGHRDDCGYLPPEFRGVAIHDDGRDLLSASAVTPAPPWVGAPGRAGVPGQAGQDAIRPGFPVGSGAWPGAPAASRPPGVPPKRERRITQSRRNTLTLA